MMKNECNFIKHKFIEHDFQNQLYTENAILKSKKYSPEVLFIGTSNHGWDWNQSDFFYGRDMYFWTCLANLFLYGRNKLLKKRNIYNDCPKLVDIFKICCDYRISFADIVLRTNESANFEVFVEKKMIIFDGNYVWKGYKDINLDFLGSKGYLDVNNQNIIEIRSQPHTIIYLFYFLHFCLRVVYLHRH